MNGYLNSCGPENMNYWSVGASNAGLANAYASSGEECEESPVERQIDSLSRRLDSVSQLLATLVDRANPVLRADVPPKEPTPICESGQSPLHAQLVALNGKASDIARFVDHTISRFTI